MSYIDAEKEMVAIEANYRAGLLSEQDYVTQRAEILQSQRHEHDWHDITAIGDTDTQFVCTGCTARTTGSAREAAKREAAAHSPENDGWDGMRRFIRQMGEGYKP